MSDKSIFDAIVSRDLRAIGEQIHEQYGLCTCGKIFEPLAALHGIGCGYRAKVAADIRKFTNCDLCDVNHGHREMNASGVEGVIRESCDEKLWREQR